MRGGLSSGLFGNGRAPDKLKANGAVTKRIVKRLGERYLPRDIIYRRKSGFGVPLAAWLRDRQGLGRYLDLFDEPVYRQRGYLQTKSVRRLADEHRSGRADHSDLLWELINLELWQRIFIDRSYSISAAPGRLHHDLSRE